MPHDVFVSHSSKDKTTADAVVATLEARGMRCWVAPRDIVPGADWGESIVEAIGSSKVMVLVFSQHANESVQIKREIERAVSKGVVVVPFRIEEVVPTKSLEYFLSTPHWLDAYTPPLEAHLGYLADTVSNILQGGGAELKPPKLVPRPAPWWRKRATLYALGVVALIAFFIFKPGPSVKQQVAGSWKLTSMNAEPNQPIANVEEFAPLMQEALAAHHASGTLKIDGTGQTTIDLAVDSTGTASTSGGTLAFTSDGEASTSSSYLLNTQMDPQSMQTMGVKQGQRVLDTDNTYVSDSPRVSSSVVDPEVVGSWYRPPSRGVGGWYANITIDPDGRYKMSFTRELKGLVGIVQSQWSFDGSGQLLNGAFTFKGNDLTIPDNFGSTSWKRG